MEDGKRRTFSGRTGIEARPARQHQGTKSPEHINAARRKQYASDPGYAAKQRQASRATYRKDHPLEPSRLSNGLLHQGQLRELYTDEMDHPVSVEAFTVREAALALGRSELGLKRWISDGIVPPPILLDTVRRYRHYSVGELRTIARVLRDHEEEFKYLTVKHTPTIHTMWQSIQAYRAMHI